MKQAVEPNVRNIFDRSNDTHIGQTLVRMARLAASAHHYEVYEAVRNESDPQVAGQGTETINEGGGIAGGIDRPCSPSVQPAGTDAGPIHTEVGR